MDKEQQETFLIHFDTRGNHDEIIHKISLETFIKTTQSLEKTLDGFNEKLFDKKLDFKIFILPPDDGGFFTKLILIITTGLAYMMTSDYGDSFIKELTGKNRSEWGTSHASLLKEVTKGFFETNNEKIKSKNYFQKEFPKAFAGRSDFYKTCLENKSIRGVEFCNNYKFITRDKFPHYISESIEEILAPEYKIHKLKLISAVISKLSNDKKFKSSKLPKWKGNDYKNNKSLEFDLMDERFNINFLNDKYPIKEINTIVAKFEYKKIKKDGEINANLTKISAVEIYNFNNEKINNIPSDLDIILVGDDGVVDKELELPLFKYLNNNTNLYDQ